MHQSFHTSTNAPTHNHIIHTHSNILVNTQTYSHIHNKTHKHTNTTTSTNWLLRYDRFWGFRWIAHPRRPKLFLSYILLPPHTVNMTLSPSLNSNGHQLGSSEYVISHCPLCPVKLSTEFCMIWSAALPPTAVTPSAVILWYKVISHQ